MIQILSFSTPGCELGHREGGEDRERNDPCAAGVFYYLVTENKVCCGITSSCSLVRTMMTLASLVIVGTMRKASGRNRDQGLQNSAEESLGAQEMTVVMMVTVALQHHVCTQDLP